MWFPRIAIDFVFVLDIVILYFLAIMFKWYAINMIKFKNNQTVGHVVFMGGREVHTGFGVGT